MHSEKQHQAVASWAKTSALLEAVAVESGIYSICSLSSPFFAIEKGFRHPGIHKLLHCLPITFFAVLQKSTIFRINPYACMVSWDVLLHFFKQSGFIMAFTFLPLTIATDIKEHVVSKRNVNASVHSAQKTHFPFSTSVLYYCHHSYTFTVSVSMFAEHNTSTQSLFPCYTCGKSF